MKLAQIQNLLIILFLLQLYQLDLRLREVTMRPNQLFGNVSIFCFGDVLQLKPVMGRYIWSTPRSEEYLQAFMVSSHWEQFDVVSLVENHRQENDRDFADILNTEIKMKMT